MPFLGEVPNFKLIDSEGKNFSSDLLREKIWVVDFIFTNCAGPCPVMSNEMSKLHRRFSKIESIEMLSISVDPERDTPEVLREYAQKFSANIDHHHKWHFLTGSRNKIHELAVNGFKLGSKDEPINHSTYFTLVDREGKIRGYYDGTDRTKMSQLARDINFLLRR